MKKKHLIIILFIFYFSFEIASNGQQLNYSSDFYTTQQINFFVHEQEQTIFSSLKPLIKAQIQSNKQLDSTLNKQDKDKKFLIKHKASWFYRKLRTENFIDLKNNDFHLQINPLFWLEYKQQQNDERRFFTNTRGIEFKADLGKSFSFYSSFHENQSRFPDYISNYILTSRVVPGQGAVKIDNHNPNRYDYSHSEAYLSIAIKRKFHLQIGHSKQFIGEGYRSLILSDNSFSYPFLKMSYNIGKFRYLIMWSQHQLFEGAYYSYHQRKYASMNSISWIPLKGMEIALFETVNWPGNTPDNPLNFNLNFFNPLLLFRSLQYGLKNNKNILWGINLRKRITKFEQFYAQFVLDELKKSNSGKNKYAFQLGVKSFDIFRDKWYRQHLFVLAEYNQVQPYTYANSNTLQSYTHYNQALAHPAGSGLREYVSIIDYRFHDVFVSIKINRLNNSLDTLNSNFGSNILLSEIGSRGNEIGQGIKNTVQNIHISLGLIINQVTNMKIYAELIHRKEKNTIKATDNMFFSFGIKTDINNYYFDY